MKYLHFFLLLSLLLQLSSAKRSRGRGGARRQRNGNRRRGTTNRAKKPSPSTSNQKKRSGNNSKTSTARKTSTAAKPASRKFHNAGTYVIENKKEGKKYVGRSSDIKKRLKQHNSGTGAKWTSNSNGKWNIVKTYKENDSVTEHKIVRGVMRNEGVENVRGGPYTKTQYSQHEMRAIKRAIEF